MGNANGAGIYLGSGTLTLNNVSVTGNKSGFTGTAAAGGNSSGTSNGHNRNGGNGSNGASGYGGGIFMYGGTLNLLSNSSVTGNSVYGQNGGNGGNGQAGSASAQVTYSPFGGNVVGHDHTDTRPGGNGGSGGNGGLALGGGIYQAGGTLKSPSGTKNVSNNTAIPGNGGSGGAGGPLAHWSDRGQGVSSQPGSAGSGGSTGASAPDYSRSGGQTVFTGNSTVNAQSTAGLYQSSGSINQSALALSNQLKRLPGVVVELYSDDDRLIATAKTDQNGRYRFNTDYSGIGYVHIASLQTFELANKGLGFPGGVVSTFDSITGKSDRVQWISGSVVNTKLNVVLFRIDSIVSLKSNSISLVRSDTGASLWQTQLMPKWYHGGFTASTFDFNKDTSPDYVLITKTGKAMVFIVDARTGQSTRLNGQVASNLRKGFVVQTANLAGDSQPELILAPSRDRSGRISVIDPQARKVLWNATDFVLGGMKVKPVGSNSTGHSTLSNLQLVSERLTFTYKVLDGATGKLIETMSARTRLAERHRAVKALKMATATEAAVPSSIHAISSSVARIPRKKLNLML